VRKILFYVGIGIVLPFIGNASGIFYQQPIGEATNLYIGGGTGRDQIIIKIPGNLMSNVGTNIDQITVKAKQSHGSGQTLSSYISCYTESTYTTPCSTANTNAVLTVNAGTDWKYWTATYSSPVPYNSSYYYKVVFDPASGSSVYYTYIGFNTSLTSLYSAYRAGGTYYDQTANGTPAISFLNYGLSGETRITTYISPTNRQVGLSTTPTISYTYFNTGAEEYNESGINLRSDFQSIAIANQAITSTGNTTFTVTPTLSNNTVYNWTPYLRNTETGLYLYGQTQSFTVGANSTPIIGLSTTTLSRAEWDILQQVRANMGLSTTSYDNVSGGTSGGDLDLTGFANIKSYLLKKQPFVFFSSITDLYIALSTGVRTATSTGASWHYESGPASSTINLMPLETVAEYPIIRKFNEVAGYLITFVTYLLLAILAVKSI